MKETEFSTDNLLCHAVEKWGWVGIHPKFTGYTEKDWHKCPKCKVGTKKMVHFRVINDGESFFPLCDNPKCEDRYHVIFT